MSKSYTQKETTVARLTDNLSASKGVVFADFQGLKANEIETLRLKCHTAGIHYVVAKKTLLRIALKNAGLAIDPKTLPGSLATFIGTEDEIAPAKLVIAYAKAHEALKVVGGILGGNLIAAGAVKALSALPSKQEIIARLLGSIRAPLSGLVGVFSGSQSKFVQVLSQIQKSKSK